MRTERFRFAGASGDPLVGRFELPEGPARAFAIFAHCFACTKQSVAAVRTSRGLASHGIGVLRFDFTGLGDEGEEYADAFSGNVGDLVAAAAAMAAVGRAPSLLVGHSLGGAAALAACTKLPHVSAIATIGAPFDVEHVKQLFRGQLADIARDGEAEVNLGGRSFRVDQAFLDDLAAHEQRSHIAKLRRAILVLHSPTDEIVGIENASAIFLAAQHPKSFVALDGADHLLSDPLYADYVASLIASWSQLYSPDFLR